MNYCQKCGKPNDPDAIFCNKCGHSFRTATRTAPPVAKATVIAPETDDEEIYYEQQLARLRAKKKRVAPPSMPMNGAQANSSALVIHSQEVDGEDDDDEQGVSLQSCPEITQLEIEEIKTDSYGGVTFGELVRQAEIDKARQGV